MHAGIALLQAGRAGVVVHMCARVFVCGRSRELKPAVNEWNLSRVSQSQRCLFFSFSFFFSWNKMKTELWIPCGLQPECAFLCFILPFPSLSSRPGKDKAVISLRSALFFLPLPLWHLCGENKQVVVVVVDAVRRRRNK